MRHDLTPDIVEQLQRQYEEDLARTRAIYSMPWRQYTCAGKFERQRDPKKQRPAVLLGILAWLFVCLAISGIVRFVDGVRVPKVEELPSWFGSLK